MTISVYIPVNDENLDKLKQIVYIYNTGTIIPDEIVINGYGIDSEDNVNYLMDIMKEHDNVIVYAKKSRGELSHNNNMACTLTKGDIIMYNDPEMFPSCMRVELVKEQFDDGAIAVHHTTYHYDVLSGDINLNKIKVLSSNELYERYFPFKQLDHVWNYARTYGTELGVRYVDIKSISIRREVLNDIKWKESHQITLYKGNDDGQFYDFAIETLYKYNKSVILQVPLTIIK